MITRQQYDFLTRGIQEGRVQHLRGQSHLEAWDVRRHLIRAFGYGGWDLETKSLALVRELDVSNGAGKPRWTVVYRAEVRLTIKAPDGTPIAVYEDAAAGDSQNQPSLGDAHDMAMKTALSQALKRTAVNLGDQFGLSLYNGGAADPVVNRSLVAPDGTATTQPPADTEPVQPEPAPAAPPEPEPEEQPPRPADPDPAGLRDWALSENRTADGLTRAKQRLIDEHPEVAIASVVNEAGEREPLEDLLARRARELAPSGQNGQSESREDRRRKRMHALFTEKGYTARPDRLSLCALVTGQDLASTKELTHDQVEKVIAALERHDATNTPIGASA